ncbi:hypothetical protein F5141DRAFT_1059936 [Pisolithus sp. B1]|nr:hypothetical protein F5141DRAFT_1059936 [Pisolithus sp. B1]
MQDGPGQRHGHDIHLDKWRQLEIALMHLKMFFGMLEYLESTIPPSGPSMDTVDLWMGTITTDPEICQCLFDSCIPIWLMWKPNTVPEDLKVHKSIKITCPEGIVTELEVFKVGQTLKWASGYYLPGDLHHQQTRQSPVISLEQFASPPWPDPCAVTAGENFVAVHSDGTPLTSTSSRMMAPDTAPSTGQSLGTGVVRMERTKQHGGPYSLAGSTPTNAMVTPNAELWQDLDDPAIPPLMLRYLQNWLGSWTGWIMCLATTGNKVHEAANLFGLLLVKVQCETPSYIQFRDITLSLADLGTIDLAMKSKILWDLYEHNFWFKLIFPGDLELTMFDEPFPRKNNRLGSLEPQTKLESMERLRTLLASWPGFPSNLEKTLLPSVSVTCVQAVEKKVALFYMQSFLVIHPSFPSLFPTMSALSMVWITT